MAPTEYVIMKEQIDKLVARGVNQLAQQLGQMTQQHVPGTPQRVTMPMTMSTSGTVTVPSLIDLDAPQEQMYTQAIPLPEGSGPLANLQVDQKLCELKRARQRELETWIDIEWKDYAKFSKEMEAMTENLVKSRHLIKIDKASQKITLLQQMLTETMNSDGTLGNVITEFLGRFQAQELDFSNQMVNLMSKENEKLTRMLMGHQGVAPQATEETASVGSAWDCLPNV